MTVLVKYKEYVIVEDQSYFNCKSKIVEVKNLTELNEMLYYIEDVIILKED